jgi:type I restriction enzyme S subunit
MMFCKGTNFQSSPIGKIPQDWEVAELDSLAEIHDSKRVPLSKMEREDRKGPYPYCGANGIIDYINDYIFDGEYVLLAEDGGSYGKFENTAYVMNGKFWVNNHAHILRAIEGRASNQFLKTALDFLDLNLYIVGSTRKKLNQERMREIKIPTPPLTEQRAIVGVLGVVDSAIELADKVIAKTERLKKGLMQHLLTHGIGHTEYKDTPIGKMPKLWLVSNLDVVSEVIMGQSPPGETYNENGEGTPLINGPTEFGEENPRKAKWTTNPTKLTKENDVLICVRGHTTGRLSISDGVYCIGRGVAAIRGLEQSLSNRFLYYVLEENQNKIFQRSYAAGSTFPNMTRDQLGRVQIPLPSLEEQRKIAEVLASVTHKLQLGRKEQKKLERIKTGLMDLLLTGKIRIKVD